MEFGILGPLRVEDGERLVAVSGAKERAVLGLLVVEAGTVVSSDRMIFELWGDDAPRDAPAALRTHVSRLRKALGSGDILTHKPGYVLSAGPDRIDAGRFEALADRAGQQRTDPAEAAHTARRALSEWRGPALSDLDQFGFAAAEARRLEQRRIATLELAIDNELQGGRHLDLIPELTVLTTHHPYHERFRQQLMLALYRADRAGEALEAYAEATRTLGEGLGIGPSAALRSLEEAIVLQDPVLELSTQQTPNNLPFSVSTFVGRFREIEGLGEALGRSRIVTLTGVGGCGKSRLALEVASRSLQRFVDGVWQVELASLRDPEAVPVAVSMALGEPGSHATDPVASLVDYLAPRHVLLVLDNCEHLLAACADLVTNVAQRCPRLTVLATSREPLRVPGESVWLVPPLTLPDPDEPPERQEEAEAFVLFDERARAASGFTVSEDDRRHITELCRHLSGLPLAIELAAARSAAFTPEQLVDRLAEGLDILGAASSVDDRNRTMRGSLEWSHRLLDERLAGLFRRLAVFVGGWSIDDAAAVAAVVGQDVAGDIGALVDKSLVDVPSPSRYRLLEPVREYARELFQTSADADEVRARHAAHFEAKARANNQRLKGAEQLEALASFEADHDNLRKAIGWALSSDEIELAFDLVAACAWFWFMAGHWRESWTWLAKALDQGGDRAPEARARALYTAGGMQIIRANSAPVLAQIADALEICRAGDDRFGEAWCLHLLGHAEMREEVEPAIEKLRAARRIFDDLGAEWEVAWSDRYIGDLVGVADGVRGVELELASISAFREMGDTWSTAYGFYNVAGNMNHLPEYGPAAARPYLLRCLRISEDIGDPVWAAHAIRTLGEASYLDGQADAAALLEDAADRLRLLGDDTCLSTSLGLLGDLRAEAGEPAEAAGLMAEALRIRRRMQSPFGMSITLVRLGLLAHDTGHPREAARLAAALAPVASAWPSGVPEVYRTMHGRLMDAVGADPEAPGETIEEVVPFALEVAEMIRQEHPNPADTTRRA